MRYDSEGAHPMVGEHPIDNLLRKPTSTTPEEASEALLCYAVFDDSGDFTDRIHAAAALHQAAAVREQTAVLERIARQLENDPDALKPGWFTERRVPANV